MRGTSPRMRRERVEAQSRHHGHLWYCGVEKGRGTLGGVQDDNDKEREGEVEANRSSFRDGICGAQGIWWANPNPNAHARLPGVPPTSGPFLIVVHFLRQNVPGKGYG